MQKNDGKKVILVVSFGTTYQETREATIEACENRIAQSFPGYEIRRAFTSSIVRKVLRERDNVFVDDTGEALLKIKKDDFSEVIVQPLHIIPGEEYHEKILKPVREFKGQFARLAVGKPILFGHEDYMTAIEALKVQMPKLKDDQAVILMGHGSDHPANACYAMLQLILFDTLPNVFVATVEGYPELDDVIAKLKARDIREVTLMPYMLVAGDHAINDMAGDEKDSWKNILEEEGFKVGVYLHGLGENVAYQDIYAEHVRSCIEQGRAE
jgi:sirohydrochlorin cobaltochelatase